MSQIIEDNRSTHTCRPRLPNWFRQAVPDQEKMSRMRELLREAELHTVCESARCPNQGRCWGEGVATFMILGDRCTRTCRFCAVEAGRPNAINTEEPFQVAQAVQRLHLSYVVVTSVTRDDLKDGGAEQFARTIQEIRAVMPSTKIEVLIPDFRNQRESLKKVVDAHPDVVSHNLETVRNLSPVIRPQADYDRSLDVLENIKQMGGSILVKSGLMVGLGESREEVLASMRDLLEHGCDILTIGQYLAPSSSKRHVKVQRFVTPDEFEDYKVSALRLGFKYVESGPLVRSSFIAEQGFKAAIREKRKG